ncbi:MAG: nucleotidyltransferase family protein [Deltaproteobacteria bacterium]|nr:nucleotidyltransferase family protein [Deltaproteobacteria bacterium]
MKTSSDIRALVGLSGLTPGSAHREELIRLLSLIRDMDFLLDLAVREGVASMLYKNFMKHELLETLSASQRKRLKDVYYQALRLNLRLIRDLKQVLGVMNKKRIQVVLLQGIILLAQLYSDIGMRPLTDIDLWVLQEDYTSFIGVLEALGYERDPLYPKTFRRGLTVLDLHTHILGADRISSRSLLLPKDQSDIFSNTHVIDFDGCAARCLNKYDQVFYLGLHALKHNVGKLMWLVDIKALLVNWSESDWTACVRRTEELGQRRTLSYILFLLTHLLDFQMPIKAQQFMETTRLNCLETHLLRRRIRGNSLPLWAPLVLFSPEKGVRKCFIHTLETLFPRPEIMRQVFEGSAGLKAWQLYCLRVLQLMRMAKASLKVSFGL